MEQTVKLNILRPLFSQQEFPWMDADKKQVELNIPYLVLLEIHRRVCKMHLYAEENVFTFFPSRIDH